MGSDTAKDRARPALRWRIARWPRALTAVTTLLFTAALAACGSSTITASRADIKRTCKQVEAVLSDGPEPIADPVGYAQAQVLPLRQIHTPDASLQKAIDSIASVYEALSAGKRVEKPPQAAVTAASARINAICPGAAS